MQRKNRTYDNYISFLNKVLKEADIHINARQFLSEKEFVRDKKIVEKLKTSEAFNREFLDGLITTSDFTRHLFITDGCDYSFSSYDYKKHKRKTVSDFLNENSVYYNKDVKEKLFNVVVNNRDETKNQTNLALLIPLSKKEIEELLIKNQTVMHKIGFYFDVKDQEYAGTSDIVCVNMDLLKDKAEELGFFPLSMVPLTKEEIDEFSSNSVAVARMLSNGYISKPNIEELLKLDFECDLKLFRELTPETALTIINSYIDEIPTALSSNTESELLIDNHISKIIKKTKPVTREFLDEIYNKLKNTLYDVSNIYDTFPLEPFIGVLKELVYNDKSFLSQENIKEILEEGIEYIANENQSSDSEIRLVCDMIEEYPEHVDTAALSDIFDKYIEMLDVMDYDEGWYSTMFTKPIMEMLTSALSVDAIGVSDETFKKILNTGDKRLITWMLVSRTSFNFRNYLSDIAEMMVDANEYSLDEKEIEQLVELRSSLYSRLASEKNIQNRVFPVIIEKVIKYLLNQEDNINPSITGCTVKTAFPLIISMAEADKVCNILNTYKNRGSVKTNSSLSTIPSFSNIIDKVIEDIKESAQIYENFQKAGIDNMFLNLFSLNPLFLLETPADAFGGIEICFYPEFDPASIKSINAFKEIVAIADQKFVNQFKKYISNMVFASLHSGMPFRTNEQSYEYLLKNIDKLMDVYDVIIEKEKTFNNIKDSISFEVEER